MVKFYPLLKPAYGLHPMFLDQHRPIDLEMLEAYLASPKCLAVGEIGLDYFITRLNREAQAWYFEAQLSLAQNQRLPVILHIRKAYDPVLATLRRLRFKQGGIVHAFAGSEQQAKQFIELGFKLGFGGAMTYPRALKLRRLAATLPLSCLVLETDSPDMLPVFARPCANAGVNEGASVVGSKAINSPLNLPAIAQELAGLRGLGLVDLLTACRRNTCDALKLD
jgi:TatD DNase family protein